MALQQKRFLCPRMTMMSSQSLMVQIDMSKLTCDSLIFVDPGVKIDMESSVSTLSTNLLLWHDSAAAVAAYTELIFLRSFTFNNFGENMDKSMVTWFVF